MRDLFSLCGTVRSNRSLASLDAAWIRINPSPQRLKPFSKSLPYSRTSPGASVR